jgi:ParB-like chromosome segregation protein Spo0J
MNVLTVEINPREIRLLETNARYMKHEEFNRLVDNVRKDGKLTSTPFLCKEADGKWLCLSGNHRTRAAIEVGLEMITCLATDDPLTEEQKIAIQLSHNAIAGQDDPATLKALYEKILDTSLKKYSGLDDKTLELLDKFASISISEANLTFQTLSMVFLPNELEEA